MGEIPLIAEDLGVITPEVTALRKRYHLPGMAVLQFGFDHFDDNPHKPHNIHPDTVVYTGTHDNDTCLGWFRGLDAEMRQRVMQELNITDESQLVDAMIERALHSRANLTVLPLQDLLKLGSEARMNTPGTTEENWGWHCDWAQLTPHLATALRLRIEAAQRSNG
jgi:4-alpha-glucanotransferase